MRKLIDFSKTPCIIDVTDEEFAEYERRNAKEIELREIMRGHDEAQAMYNARTRGTKYVLERFASVADDLMAKCERLHRELAELKTENEQLRKQISEQEKSN